MIWVCLFDIDGTLVNTGGAGRAAVETALCEEFGLPGLRGRVPYSGRTDRAILCDLLELHGLEATPVIWQRLVTGYLRRLPDCLRRHIGQVLPGIPALLQQLKQRNVVVGLLTGNLRAGAYLKLAHFHLEHHFPFGGFGDTHYEREGVAREALQAVRAHLRWPVPPENIWVVGDTPLDVRCARAIGARAVAVATGWHDRRELAAAGPDLLLDDFHDPEPLLNACR